MQVHKSVFFRGLVASLMLALALGACSSDKAASLDGGTGNDGSAIGDAPGLTDSMPSDGADDASAEPKSCTALVNGTACGAGSICLFNVCVSSSCGDGFIDVAAAEECEDSNTVSGDGCSLCRWECKANATCDDGNACNGTEACTLATHACARGTAATNGAACVLSPTAAGACNNGRCVSAGCGNGVTDSGEQCDDGNAIDTDGCTRGCKFGCVSNSDCDDGAPCNGIEVCLAATHKCDAGNAVTCAANGCKGECRPIDGKCVYQDADRDGSTCDQDCDDKDAVRSPRALECADGKDNDCNTSTDELGEPACRCYLDTDKDGYAADVVNSIALDGAGSCPSGYTRTRPTDATNTDCAPKLSSVSPQDKSPLPIPYCQPKEPLITISPLTSAAITLIPVIPLPCSGTWSYDYNCDGKETSLGPFGPLPKLAADACAGAADGEGCRYRSGWVASVPACGGTGTYRQCTYDLDRECRSMELPGFARACL